MFQTSGIYVKQILVVVGKGNHFYFRGEHRKLCLITCALNDNINLLFCAVTELYFVTFHTLNNAFWNTKVIINPIKHVAVFVDEGMERSGFIFPLGYAMTLIGK